MKPHTIIYLSSLGYHVSDFIPSELSLHKAQDIHHIEPRGMGGSKGKDRIENLMALTREEHIKYGDKKQFKHFLLTKHKEFLISKKAAFNIEYINNKIQQYEQEHTPH